MNNPTIWQDVATPVAIDATVSCTSGTAAPNCVATSSVIYAHCCTIHTSALHLFLILLCVQNNAG